MALTLAILGGTRSSDAQAKGRNKAAVRMGSISTAQPSELVICDSLASTGARTEANMHASEFDLAGRTELGHSFFTAWFPSYLQLWWWFTVKVPGGV